VAEGLHYIVDIQGTEELYDLATDTDELHDLKNAPGQKPALGRFRASLRQVLNEHRISSGIARDYQERFRVLLEALERQLAR
jgi:hypothetical protein